MIYDFPSGKLRFFFYEQRTEPPCDFPKGKLTSGNYLQVLPPLGRGRLLLAIRQLRRGLTTAGTQGGGGGARRWES